LVGFDDLGKLSKDLLQRFEAAKHAIMMGLDLLRGAGAYKFSQLREDFIPLAQPLSFEEEEILLEVVQVDLVF
jgi:hypothetical protein